MRIRAVYFDAVGTLIHPEPSAAAVYAEVGRRHGSKLGRDVIHARFTTAFTRQEEIDRAAGWRTSEERERRRWQRIVTEVLDDVADPEACFAELYDYFAQSAAWRCDAAAPGVLAELTRRGHVIGLASNYDHRLHHVLDGLDGLHDVRAVLVSAEIGWRKPARQFFEALCGQSGAAPQEVLYVGDDPDNDYAGAVAAGLQAVLLSSAPPTQGVRTISRLDGLLE